MTLFTDLSNAAGKLTNRDKAFADSILNQWQTRGSISPKQEYWAKELVNRANKPQGPTAQGITLTPIADLFRKAREHLKRPKIVIQSEGLTLKLTLAADTSKNPGYIYVKDDCGNYQGKVSPSGEFTAKDSSDTGLVKALRTIAADPAKAASDHGHLSGRCCFCNLTLTDARSVAVGYGPICAENYGLPWG